jgi:hypothetical protein
MLKIKLNKSGQRPINLGEQCAIPLQSIMSYVQKKTPIS